jgi:hypothetical protein
MAGHGLRRSAQTRPLIASYLRRTRWIRTIGFLVGWNVPYAWMWMTRSAYRMAELGTHWWVAGFAAGIIIAEVVRPRDSGEAVGLEPRRLIQYLPRFTRIDTWILVCLVTLVAVAGVLLPVAGAEPPDESAITRNSAFWYLASCFVAIAIIAATRIAQEMIVRRRQSFDDLDQARADDAMRSVSIQALAGLGYGGPMWIVATMGWDLTVTTRAPISGAMGVLSFVLALGGLGMMLGFARLNGRWIVPRAREA